MEDPDSNPSGSSEVNNESSTTESKGQRKKREQRDKKRAKQIEEAERERLSIEKAKEQLVEDAKKQLSIQEATEQLSVKEATPPNIDMTPYKFAFDPKTRYKNIEYTLAEYASEHVLCIDSMEEWEMEGKPHSSIKAIAFDPNFDVTDKCFTGLANAPEEFRFGLRAIFAGSHQKTSTLSLTENVFRNIFDARCFPNLLHIHFLNSVDLSTNAVLGVLRSCPKIKYIAFVAKPGRELFMSAMALLSLCERPPKNLKYLEMNGFEVDDMVKGLIGTPTQKVKDLEMVFGNGSQLKVYKHGVSSKVQRIK